MLTQSPANHKINSKLKEQAPHWNPTLGLQFKFNVKGEDEQGGERVRKNTCQTYRPLRRKAHTEKRNLNLLRQTTMCLLQFIN